MTENPTPAPCVNMDRMVSIYDEHVSILDVRLVRATEGTFAGFGRIIQSFVEAEVDIVTWPAQGWRPGTR